MITIFHWDIPRWLQNIGGLTNPLFVDYFEVFANVLFENFGSKVDTWITMNEPFNFCTQGYGVNPTWAPNISSPGVGEYLCGHYMLLAHARAYRLYRKKYFKKFGGKVGITAAFIFRVRIQPEKTAIEHNSTDWNGLRVQYSVKLEDIRK